jgi:hypothetical protein
MPRAHWRSAATSGYSARRAAKVAMRAEFVTGPGERPMPNDGQLTFVLFSASASGQIIATKTRAMLAAYFLDERSIFATFRISAALKVFASPL